MKTYPQFTPQANISSRKTHQKKDYNRDCSESMVYLMFKRFLLFKIQRHCLLTIPSKFLSTSSFTGHISQYPVQNTGRLLALLVYFGPLLPSPFLSKSLVKNKCYTICAMIDLAGAYLFRAPPAGLIYMQVKKEWN